MFQVTIDIWPHGDFTRPERHTTIVACNDGTGSPYFGNYQAITVEHGDSVCAADQRLMLIDCMRAGATAKVTGFPRGHDQHHLPALVARLIEALGLPEYLTKQGADQ